MARAVVTFTDFGHQGPYLGEVRLALLAQAPEVPVVDLMADAPAFDVMGAAYLLAALMPRLPKDCVVLGVVDPGVGGARAPLVIEADGRFLVGPDNGLFEPVLRRAGQVRSWRIDWRPAALSSTFHGRDLFAPVAARLAKGLPPEQAGCTQAPATRHEDWPDDLARIVYVDGYGNCMTGMRADNLPQGATLHAAGRVLPRGRTFSDLPPGTPFWYSNSSGLAEISVAEGSAASVLGLRVGAQVEAK